MFVVNFGSMELAIIGMLAVMYVADMVTASVPMLVLVRNGVGAAVLTPIISVLIVLGAISTGVNMIAGIDARCFNALERLMDASKRHQGHMIRMAIFTLIFVAIAWGIAQFGLMTVVKKGYAYLVTVFIPFVIHAIVTQMKEI